MKKFDFKKIAMTTAGVAAGAVAGTIANKPMANMNPKIRGAIKIAVGAVLPELMPKVELLKGVGAGIIATGAIDIYQGFTSISGVDGIGNDDMSIGAEDMAIGAEDYIITDTNVSGIDDEMNGIGADDNAVQGIGDENQSY